MCDNLWEPSTVYTGGDQVCWAGKLWQAKWWSQGDDPTKSGEWGVWTDLGEVTCSTN
ncbi:carbohydrate-binding protein [Vibrio sp. ZSDZ34]|uniref:Carbohydrate-binding protein n=1 Tax=Vibrio gelatinilyticus TaxID=2893468 RepID=A0A9X2AXH3_9VIBR|nr:carbohydrate-binding protein [Vibrio gelatinilyticus]MCJ2378416.1 carbohydrate-binding protein [Vibrio gelatinilyticus]